MSVCPIAVATVTLVWIVGPPRTIAEDFEKLGSTPLVAPAPEARLPRVLRVAWIDVTDAAPGVAPIALAEAKAVLGTAGLGLLSRRASASELARPDEIRVILLSSATIDRAARAPVLGATPIEPNAMPYVWIHVPSVQATLGLPPRRSPIEMSLPELRAVGVAIGRVVAHEIVHTLIPGLPHGTGLMSARFTRQQLTAARMPIEPEVARAVRTALRGETTREREVGLLAAGAAGEEARP
jgi:hypothetical protein